MAERNLKVGRIIHLLQSHNRDAAENGMFEEDNAFLQLSVS